MLTLLTGAISWRLREPFTIARGTASTADGVLVVLFDEDGHIGRGEAYGVNYRHETPDTMLAQIAAAAADIRAGIGRRELLGLLPAGGARCAVDAALWDIEAKRSGIPAWRSAGLPPPLPKTSAVTIGIGDPARMRARAAELSHHTVLKIKVDANDPLSLLQAVREGAPRPAIILDPNASWSIDLLNRLLPRLRDLGVVLIEQPLAPEDDAALADIPRAIPICADESIHGPGDLDRIAGRYDVVNIKLDKTGGLTAALDLADAAQARGFRLMVGCMWGSSLAMAPAAVLAQRCQFVDLDGPLLQVGDHQPAIRYDDGLMAFPQRELWG